MSEFKYPRILMTGALFAIASAAVFAAGPGKIEAENYTVMAGVATEACSDTGGGQDVGWIDKGDYMVYPITIPTTGAYTISYRVATPNGGVALSSDLNAGTTVLGNVNVPNTGGWQTWQTVTQTVNLNAGSYNFGINAGTGGFNLNWFSIDSVGSTVSDGTPYFMIVNKYSGLAMDLIGGDTSNGARINQWTYDYNGANQRWAILPTENKNHFKLVSAVSGKSACIDMDSMDNGAQLHAWDYTGNNPGQQFDLVDAGNGWFKIRNVKSGKVLDDSGFGKTNDTKIVQWDDAGGDNQLWRLQPWGDNYIRSASGRYVCVANMGNSDGSRIIQYDGQDNPWFKWRFLSRGDGWLSCNSLNALSKVLCVSGPSTTAGTYCHLWEYNNSNIGDQKLRIVPQLDGTYKFYFQFDGQTWDIPGGQTGNNVELDQYPENGNSWQKFRMTRKLDLSGVDNGGGGGGGTTTNLIPLASGKQMTFQFQNNTGGKYADSQIYVLMIARNNAGKFCWLDKNGNMNLCGAGQNASSYSIKMSDFAGFQFPTFLDSGRLYVSLGTPLNININSDINGNVGIAFPNIENASDPNINTYFEWVEFAVINNQIWCNTTQVDQFGFPMVMELFQAAGSSYNSFGKVGVSDSRTNIYNSWNATVPSEFKGLATTTRILAPLHGSFRAGQAHGNYFDGYINSVWSQYSSSDLVITVPQGTFHGRVQGDSRMAFTAAGVSGTYYVNKPTSEAVWGGLGALATGNTIELVLEAQICAAFHRHVIDNASLLNNVSQYYHAGPADYFSKFWHEHSINARAYGFCYDDVNDQSSTLTCGSPRGIVLSIGF